MITNNDSHQPKIIIREAPSIEPYLEAHPSVKEAYENEVIRPMENGEFPGKLADNLGDGINAYRLYLKTGELVIYQVTSQDKVPRKYFILPLAPADEIEAQKAKRLLTKTLTHASKVASSISDTVKAHQGTILLLGAVTAIVRFFASL